MSEEEFDWSTDSPPERKRRKRRNAHRRNCYARKARGKSLWSIPAVDEDVIFDLIFHRWLEENDRDKPEAVSKAFEEAREYARIEIRPRPKNL